MTSPSWRIAGGGEVSLERPRIMGILNVTPDSFSDGGELASMDAVVGRAARMVEEGAAILDVGGESTRPGASPVTEEEELDRVVSVVEMLAARFQVPVSIDTRKARVAEAAVAAGAAIVNDVSALAFDAAMPEVLARTGAGVVLMHMRGTPLDMEEHADYADLEGELRHELGRSVDKCLSAGVRPESIVLDPGIGFAKTSDQSLRVIARLRSLGSLGFPILVGPSRKRFLGEILHVPPEERGVGTAAACVMAYLNGARLFRVHDVLPVEQALSVVREVFRRSGEGEGSGGVVGAEAAAGGAAAAREGGGTR
jgi:dihydropteroate synthase